MWSQLTALNEIEGTSLLSIGYSSVTFVAILVEFLLFATWQHFVALPKPQVLPMVDKLAE